MLILGLTGGIACGKSTVARMLEGLGARVIDADKIAHEVMRPETMVWKKIVDCFGEGILNEDLSVNRTELGKIVFASAKKRKKLEDIIHPVVIRTIRRKINKLSAISAKGVFHKASADGSASGGNVKLPAIVVIDAPLLIEADLTSLVDKLVVVTAWRRTQMRRLRKSGLKGSEAAKRIDSQMSLNKKIKLADYVIRNSGSVAEARRQVKKVWKEVLTGYREKGDVEKT